jgi:ABC-type polysaccharide/polyol phosphate transport system ATPase subunit
MTTSRRADPTVDGPRIEFQHVSKTFVQHGGPKLLRAHLQEYFRPRKRTFFYALKDVSFRVERGESLAIIGGNGAGKSTLLSLVAGLCRPAQGRVTVNGRIAALLELGSGFHPDLTGRENIFLNASFLGFDRKRAEACFDAIVEFSGVGAFIDEPLRTYSSGMSMRLAFSVAVHVDPEILLIDEVLAVGDQGFQNKCLDRIHELKRAGKTLLFVSHSAGLVQELCDRAIWLDHGECVLTGAPGDVLPLYTEKVMQTRDPSASHPEMSIL